MAVGIASSSLTAQAIGANAAARAQKTSMAGLAVALTGAIITAIALVVGRPVILAAYTDDAKVALVAAALLQVLPFFHLCDAMQCINSYLLRAYKVAVVPLLLQVIALTGIGLLGGWWLGFGPAAGALQPAIDRIMPGAPTGAATMWLMSLTGLSLAAVLLHAWYWHVVKAHRKSLHGHHAPSRSR
jgi:MATE family multidrug resistance protein